MLLRIGLSGGQQRSRRLLRQLALVLLVLSGPVASRQAAAAGGGAELGTVDTIAGPRYCDGPTRPDPVADTVRALAVDRSGLAFFDTGPVENDVVATVDTRDLSARTASAGVAVVADRFDGGVLQPATVPAASRLAVDGAGSVLAAIGDRVVEIGGVTTVAGRQAPPGAVRGSSGDGGPADHASFTAIRSIATDASGNLYIADAVEPALATFRIRVVNRGRGPVTFYRGTPKQVVVRPGDIATIAGPPTTLGPRDSPVDLPLQGVPPALAVSNDALYIATQWYDGGGTTLRSSVSAINLGDVPTTVQGVPIDPGMRRTIAGGRDSGFGGDGTKALDAEFGAIPGLTVDDEGSLYLADEDNHRVRRVSADGIVSTFAGSGPTGSGNGAFAGNNGPATVARLNHPFDVKAGPGRSIYISDRDNGQVRSVDSAGIIRSIPYGFGRVTRCPTEPAGPATALGDRPRSGTIEHVVAASDGSIYFTGLGLTQVKRVDSSGTVVSAAGLAGLDPCPQSPAGCPATDAGPATAVRLDHPSSLAAAAQGFYVFDSGNRGVRFVNTAARAQTVHGVRVGPGEMRTVVVGSQGASSHSRARVRDDLPVDAALASGRGGELFVGDSGAQTVWRVDAKGKVSAATPPPSSSSACCAMPAALAATTDGNLYIFDRRTNRVWFLNLGSRPVRVLGQLVPAKKMTAVVGSGDSGIGGEGGRAAAAQLLDVTSITVGRRAELYLADPTDNAIRRVDSDGTLVTVVGTGTYAFNGDGLRGLFTALDQPTGVAIDRCGNLLIADTRNDRLRRLNLEPPCSGLVVTSAGRGRAGAKRVLAAGGALATIGLAWRYLARRRGRRLSRPERA